MDLISTTTTEMTEVFYLTQISQSVTEKLWVKKEEQKRHEVYNWLAQGRGKKSVYGLKEGIHG